MMILRVEQASVDEWWEWLVRNGDEYTKRAKKIVSAPSNPVAARKVVIENTNKKGKHRGDKRDTTDDLIDKHLASAMSKGLSNWL